MNNNDIIMNRNKFIRSNHWYC